MPIQDITRSEKQQRLFGYKLSEELSPNNKLYKLRKLINWKSLEKWSSENIKISKLGRSRHSHRVMLGLVMLQGMYNYSDKVTSEMLEENMYWQYFCGCEYMDNKIHVSEASVRRYRKLLGEEGLNHILSESIQLGIETKAIKRKDLEIIIGDTTVQNKNIKPPHDAYLMSSARKELVKLCKENGIMLNETYAKSYRKNIKKLWSYKKDSQSKSRKKILKRLKTLLGRLIRVFEREGEKQGITMSQSSISKFSKIKKIYNQSVLSSSDKKKYKESEKVLYSLHASEVECIGKGKLHKPYEFGNKVAISVSGRKNFVLCAKSFHGNPYDGHTLDQTIKATATNTGIKVVKGFFDRGYRGHNYKHKKKIYTPDTKKKLSRQDHLMMKRRSAIEPIIGHMKQYGRMGRNFLHGIIGDILNPIISGIGINLRNIANHLQKNHALKYP